MILPICQDFCAKAKTVLKTLGRVDSVVFLCLFFLRFEISIIKTSTEKNSIFVKKSLGSASSGLPETQDFILGLS